MRCSMRTMIACRSDWMSYLMSYDNTELHSDSQVQTKAVGLPIRKLCDVEVCFLRGTF